MKTNRSRNILFWVIAVCMFGRLNQNVAQDAFGIPGEQEQAQESTKSSPIVSAAVLARKTAMDNLNAFKGRKFESEKVELRKATSNRIQSQIDTIKELNSSVSRTAEQRREKVANLKNEMDEMLAQIRSLRHEQSKKDPARLSPAMTQVSNQKSSAETVSPTKAGPSENETKAQKAVADSSSDQEKLKQFGSLVGDPVDKLLLADTLIQSQNYRTALPILLKLQKDKKMSASDLNWIRYQLARCYRRLKAFPEAEKHLRDAANSKEQEIARTTSIWWLEQMDKQKKMFESLDAMDQQLESLGADDGIKQ